MFKVFDYYTAQVYAFDLMSKAIAFQEHLVFNLGHEAEIF